MGKFLDVYGLSRVWKNIKDYIDSVVGGSSSGGGGTDNLDVYSTEETRIGTWIDGNPIYRISGQSDVSNAEINTAVKVLDLSSFNIKNVLYIDCIINSKDVVYPIPYTREFVSTNTLNVLSNVVIDSSNKLMFRTTNESIRGILFYSIKYTKTTD